MNCLDLTNTFDAISEEYLDGQISVEEAIEALELLYSDCEKCVEAILNSSELNALAGLLVEITDFENALVDNALLNLLTSGDYSEDEIYISGNAADYPQEYGEEFLEPTEYVEPSEEDDSIYFADTVSEYEDMRKQWRKGREKERKASIKNEREIPLEERYKAAMGAFKDIQEDKAQAWKLKDEAKWLVEDLQRWQKESYEWRDIFSDYYAKLGNEIAKKGSKISSDYKTPITDEDINIEEHIDDSETDVEPVEIIEDAEDKIEEQPAEEAEQEDQNEQAAEETPDEGEEAAQEQPLESLEEIAEEQGAAPQEQSAA